MTRTLFFNIHDLLKIQIKTRSKFDLLKDINFFLSYFEVTHLTDPDIVLNIGKFSPSNQDCFVVDHKYFIKENYFYCKDQEGRATWEVEIFGFDSGKAIVNFNGFVRGIEQFLIPDYLSQNLILRPLIELKLLEREYVVIHGLGLEKDGEALVISARGGAFKTRTTMDILKLPDWKLIGDDRIIIGKKCKVYSYPLFFNLVLFRSINLSNEKINGIYKKIKMICYLNASKSKNSNKIANKSRLNIFLITARRLNTGIIINLEKYINKSTAIKSTKDSSQMEMFVSGIHSFGLLNFFKYMHSYAYLYPESGIALYWESYCRLLGNILDNIPIFKMTLPEQYTNEIINEYMSILE